MQIIKGKGKTIAGRHEAQGRNDIPAPNHYDPKLDYVKHKSPGYKIGTEQRQSERPNDAPPPGTYDFNVDSIKHVGPQWSMKSSQRKGLNTSSDTPAPTHYNPRLPNDAPKFSLTARSQINNSQISNPGPDHYDLVPPEVYHSRAPQYSIAGARAEIKSTAKETPAPDTYNLGSTIKSKGTKIGTSTRSEMRPNGVPGPGNYEILGNIDEQLAKGVGATLKSRNEITSKDHTPAPGTYDAKLDYVKNHAPAFSMGTSTRT